MQVKIPKAFYDDHVGGRELPAPPVIRELARCYVIDAEHPEAGELLSDARHYSDVCTWSDNGFELAGLQASAQATAAAIVRGR